MSSQQTTHEDERVESATKDVPTLSIDPDLSVEERFTDNAINQILPARYLVKDETGSVDETPDELFDRVADNIATAEYQFADEQGLDTSVADERFEEWRDEFARLMKTQQFMPNSPTLMNAGARLQQLSACIAGDAPVYTESGLKRMENISPGDKVLTHTGSFKEVTAHWSNGVKDTIGLRRGGNRGKHYDAVMTPDHEVLSDDGSWNRSDSVENPAQPIADPDVSVPDVIDLTRYTALMNKDKPVVSDGGVVKVQNSDDPRTGEFDQQYSGVVATVDNSETFAYIAGAYLAEGDVDGTDTRFTIGADEPAFEENIVDGLTELFDTHVAVSESSAGQWKTITISSPFVADMFRSLFGSGVDEKRLPKWVFAASESYQKELLDGLLDGDGHYDGSGWKLTLANPTLAYEASLLARNIGKGVNFKLQAENELSQRPTSRIYISDTDSDRMNCVGRQSHEPVEVFDMEVADDHSFVVGDFIVHNCFVNSPKDDLVDIADTEKEWTLVQKTGGGMGGDFSKLRPKGALIDSTKGTSSGPVSFMKKFNMVAGVIKQGGVRRGAQMAELRADHPDIGRFVVAKREEGAFDNFNISVSITDEFIEAVENDEVYTLYAPQSDFSEPFEIVEDTAHFYSPEYQDMPEAVVDENLWRDHADSIQAWDWENEETVPFSEKWEAYFTEAANNGRLSVGEELRLPARFIWDLILDGAWRNGEPGLFHLDETNRKHSFDVDEHPDHRIYATNPCFTGDTLISTSNGLKRADELYESGTSVDVTVDSRLSDERSHEASSVYVTGEKDVYKLTTSEGYEIRVTDDHQFKTDDGWVEAQNLESGDSVHIIDREGQFGSHGTESLGASMGWLVGDGHIHQGDEAAVLNFYDEDSTISEQFSEFVNNEVRPAMNGQHNIGVKQIRSGEQRIKSTRLYELADEMGLVEEKLQVPDTIMHGSSDMASGFLRALFTADGHIENTEKSKAVVLSSKSESMLKDVQRLLLNFGIYSTIYTDRKEAGKTEIKGEEYEREALCDLRITKESIEVYKESIGFYRDDKSEQLDELLDSYTRGPYSREFDATVESIEYDGHETVYDLTEPKTNSLVGNGFVIHNCAEQPLEEMEACNLGHVNLSLMVEDGAPTLDQWLDSSKHEYETTQAKMYDYFHEAADIDRLDNVVRSGVRFLDNVVTMSDFPLEEIEDTVRRMRKVGLGVMGWAQMCYQMGIRYGSEESLQLARVVSNHIDETATKASHELAEERGVFDEWKDSKYADPTEYPEWFMDHVYEMPEDWSDGYAMRNHNVTTVAPTGCVDESCLISTEDGLETIGDMDTTGSMERWDELDTGVVTDDGMMDATAIYDAGFTEVKTITNAHGMSISATPDHRLKTVDDGEIVWKEARDFEEGDVIVGLRNTFVSSTNASLDVSERDNFHHNTNDGLTLPEEMSPDLAEFLGYWMGDGYTHDGVGVKLVVDASNHDIEAHVSDLGESIFGIEPTVEDRDSRRILSFGGRHLPRYFEDNGWVKESGNNGEGAASAFIPPAIRQSSEDVARAFIRGLFEADGCASQKVELSTVSEQLSKEMQSLLLSLGHLFVRDQMPADELGDDHYGDRTRYTLRGANKYQDALFIDKIGFITKDLDAVVDKHSHKNDIVPNSLLDKPSTGSKSAEFGDYVHTRATLQETATDGGFGVTDYVFSTVESVEDDVAYTKDISVPENKTYIANGFVSHNTTSMLGDTSGGIEPVYSVAYKKNVGEDIQGDEMLVEFDKVFLQTLRENEADLDHSAEEIAEIAAEQMDNNEFDGVQGLPIPQWMKDTFVTTQDLTPEEHGLMQRAFQEGVDSGISKTVNLPKEATHKDVHDAYMLAVSEDRLGATIKGLTVYRDQSRGEQVLTTQEYSDQDIEEAVAMLRDLDGYEVRVADEA